MELGRLLASERKLRVEFLLSLAEFDRRRLYLELGYSSLFVYLKEVLGLSDGSAFRRMTVCRLLVRIPALAEWLREGRVSLSKVATLRKVLTEDNGPTLLPRAAAMTEKEVEALALRLEGKEAPAVRDSIRPLPPARPPESSPTVTDVTLGLPALEMNPPPTLAPDAAPQFGDRIMNLFTEHPRPG